MQNATSSTPLWAEYANGIAWGTVALFVVTLLAYVCLAYGVANGLIDYPLGAAISTVLVYCSFTVIHEAGHGNIAHGHTKFKSLERAMGWIAALPYLIVPFGMFAKIHDYHHAFTNDPEQDPDHWVSGDFGFKLVVRALSLQGFYVYQTVRYYSQEPAFRGQLRASLTYYAISAFLVSLALFMGYGTQLLILVILPATIASFVLAMLFDWIPHKPGTQQGRYQNTRSYLFPGLKYLTLGQNYHHIHHLYPRVPWYQYEHVFKLVRPELEENRAPIEDLRSSSLPGLFQSEHAKSPSNLSAFNKLTLTVEAIQRETPDAVIITFSNLSKQPLSFKSGQYLTLSKRLNGTIVTRCYSICESPESGKLSIGVKRVAGGLMSNYLNVQLRVGDQLSVAGPFGDFIYHSSDHKPLTLIAGGSGITPIMSILQTALTKPVVKPIHLIYASRSKQYTIFLKALEKLAKQHPQSLTISYVFEQADEQWQGETGWLTPEKLSRLLEKNTLNSTDQRFYLCGPAAMKDVVLNSLKQLGVPQKQVLLEEFNLQNEPPKGQRHSVNVTLINGAKHQFEVAENQTVLHAALEKGIQLPHACKVGQCGCCMMSITSGKAIMASSDTPGLLPNEQVQGMTLACQCKPKSDLGLCQSSN